MYCIVFDWTQCCSIILHRIVCAIYVLHSSMRPLKIYSLSGVQSKYHPSLYLMSITILYSIVLYVSSMSYIEEYIHHQLIPPFDHLKNVHVRESATQAPSMSVSHIDHTLPRPISYFLFLSLITPWCTHSVHHLHQQIHERQLLSTVFVISHCKCATSCPAPCTPSASSSTPPNQMLQNCNFPFCIFSHHRFLSRHASRRCKCKSIPKRKRPNPRAKLL